MLASPRETVIVTSRGRAKLLGIPKLMDNAASVDWHMPVSAKPEIFAISLGRAQLTRELIDNSQVFAVNFIPYELKDAALICGRYSGLHKNKFIEAGLTKEEASSIDCPILKDALRVLECRVAMRHEVGESIVYYSHVLNAISKRLGSRLFHSENGVFQKL